MKARLFAALLSFLTFNVVTAAPLPQPASPANMAKKIDINHADITALTGSFKGIGKKRAQALIDYREQHGGFKSLEEISDVKGFGAKFMEKNKEQLQEVFTVG